MTIVDHAASLVMIEYGDLLTSSIKGTYESQLLLSYHSQSWVQQQKAPSSMLFHRDILKNKTISHTLWFALSWLQFHCNSLDSRIPSQHIESQSTSMADTWKEIGRYNWCWQCTGEVHDEFYHGPRYHHLDFMGWFSTIESVTYIAIPTTYPWHESIDRLFSSCTTCTCQSEVKRRAPLHHSLYPIYLDFNPTQPYHNSNYPYIRIFT